MLHMNKVCSDSEFEVRKELTGFFGKNFRMSPSESFMWVTSRVIGSGDGFTVESPFKNYVSRFLLTDVEGKHHVNDTELMLLCNRRDYLSKVSSLIGEEKMSLVNSYYLDKVGIPLIVEISGKTYGVVRKIFGDYHKAFERVVTDAEREFSSVEGTSILDLKIGWKPKSLLWDAGIHSVEELNTCFYTGSTDVSKLLNSNQLLALNETLKNLEMA